MAALLMGCSSSNPPTTGTGTGGHSTAEGGSGAIHHMGGGLDLSPLGGGSSIASGFELPPLGPDGVPEGFTKANIGAYHLGNPLDGSDSGTITGTCDTAILGVVRDFKGANTDGGHPDFESHHGNGNPGIVKVELGEDSKPVYASDGPTKDTAGPTEFDQWYRNVADVNKAYVLELFLQKADDGVLTFESSAFFPLDGAGWGNQNNDHNFSFTTEVHTHFTYNGGEHFRFIGDDDLWVFIQKKLVIDLGGLHSEREGAVELDQLAPQLGLQVGSTYPIDVFHAERHTSASNFRINTNLAFVDCGTIVPDVPK